MITFCQIKFKKRGKSSEKKKKIEKAKQSY